MEGALAASQACLSHCDKRENAPFFPTDIFRVGNGGEFRFRLETSYGFDADLYEGTVCNLENVQIAANVSAGGRRIVQQGTCCLVCIPDVMFSSWKSTGISVKEIVGKSNPERERTALLSLIEIRKREGDRQLLGALLSRKVQLTAMEQWFAAKLLLSHGRQRRVSACALGMLRKSHRRGNAYATYDLAVLYDLGEEDGVAPHRPKLAYRLFLSAANRGVPSAMRIVGVAKMFGTACQAKKREEGVALVESAAAGGDFLAARFLADCFERGEHGFCKDWRSACHWREIENGEFVSYEIAV